MNNLRTWNFEDHEVRTVEIDGEPWFVLADVCKVLELSNPSKVADRLESDEKANFELGLRGGATNCINESGLYTVVLRSDNSNTLHTSAKTNHGSPSISTVLTS